MVDSLACQLFDAVTARRINRLSIVRHIIRVTHPKPPIGPAAQALITMITDEIKRVTTFVVRRIVQWQAQGVNIDQAMLSLSTYVGHTMVTNTYWYLSAVPELMALAAGRFESFTARREVQDA
ncbi:hypothetical protein PCAR4_350009 [Paraburkholderia caribensis]|nr:hypothetical protein PCAR4_350009 [Paraburkholderia caribensis]